MDEIDQMIAQMKQETITKRCRFRRWNRQQRKQNKRGPFYHQFLVSSIAVGSIERAGGKVEGNLVTFPKGTQVFQDILGPVYLLPTKQSVARGHRFELLASVSYPSYYQPPKRSKIALHM
jgi:hypothetical protein